MVGRRKKKGGQVLEKEERMAGREREERRMERQRA